MDLRNEDILNTLLLMVIGGTSIRQLARDINVPFETLRDALSRHQSPKKPLKPIKLIYQKAINDVVQSGLSIRQAAKLNNLTKSTVNYYVQKAKNKDSFINE